MKKCILIFLLLLLWSSGVLFAQQNVFPAPPQLISPEIHPDTTVTFRLYLPHTRQVTVKGDWLPQGSASMQLQNGVWTYHSPVLAPDLYIYTFNADGTDLVDPNNVYEIRDASSLYNIFLVPGKASDLYRVQDVPHGTVACRWYSSPSLQKQRRLSVYTPAGYEDSSLRYPVLYLLHGMGGDEEAWMHLGRASQILDNLIAGGKAVPMIVVMSNGNVIQQAAPGESPEGFYTPSFRLPRTMNGEYEASFKDVVSFVDRNYRTKADKNHRGIAGLSMGGFHSLYISACYPDSFGYVGLFSPAIRPEQMSAVYEHLDAKLQKQAEEGCLLYWIGIGRDDFLYNDVEAFRQKMDTLQIPYVYKETGKGHVWSNWRNYLTEFLMQIFR